MNPSRPNAIREPLVLPIADEQFLNVGQRIACKATTQQRHAALDARRGTARGRHRRVACLVECEVHEPVAGEVRMQRKVVQATVAIGRR